MSGAVRIKSALKKLLKKHLIDDFIDKCVEVLLQTRNKKKINDSDMN